VPLLDEPYRICFVFTGNICRSPLAEVLARHHADDARLGDRVAFESFGTHDYHVGDGADPRTVSTAHGFEIDARSHRARCIGASDLGRFDLILAMDGDHERHLRRIAPTPTSDRIHLYLPFLRIDGARDVPDPYYGDADGFIAVHRLLDRAARRLVERLPDLIAQRND
jgi:protein-tyrosine phosphatase